MNIVVVYNPKSGSSLPKNELNDLFSSANITVDAWIDITDNFDTTIKKWTDNGSTIAAIGGDGTLACAANAIHGTRSVFAPLPGGTLNHFTKDAGITQNLADAILALPSSKQRTVDVATVNGDVFLNNSSIGIYPLSLETRERIEDKLGKWPAAVIGSIRAFIRFQLYDVTINGQSFKTPFLFVGNNEYQLDRAMERSRLDRGTLCIYAVKSDKRRTVFKLLGAALLGQLKNQPDLITFTTRSLTIHTKHDLVQVSTDGEVARRRSPLTYECHPGGLTIIGS